MESIKISEFSLNENKNITVCIILFKNQSFHFFICIFAFFMFLIKSY